jgi:hypothetical protein
MRDEHEDWHVDPRTSQRVQNLAPVLCHNTIDRIHQGAMPEPRAASLDASRWIQAIVFRHQTRSA